MAGDTGRHHRCHPGTWGHAGRFGQFSDLYFDPVRREWWALSDRGPGGGLLDYAVRVERLDVQVHPVTAVYSSQDQGNGDAPDPYGLLAPAAAAVAAPKALNGLNPSILNANSASLGRSFDPEGLVIDPRTGNR